MMAFTFSIAENVAYFYRSFILIRCLNSGVNGWKVLKYLKKLFIIFLVYSQNIQIVFVKFLGSPQ